MVTMADPERFRDRAHAGAQLAEDVSHLAGRRDLVVLALPRGGVPIGAVVAAALDAPLDVFLVRKLGVPGHEELAMGAIASGGTMLLNGDVIDGLQIPDEVVAAVVERERAELARRETLYRDGHSLPDLAGKTVILVDDGVATGASMLVAIAALRERNPRRIVVAVPVGAPETCGLVARAADAIVCSRTFEDFEGVGKWYEDFTQVSDEEVSALLAGAART
jgi:predicted phosphoribosyltransferase